MTFKKLNIKCSYETGNEDPVENFYIPVLKESKSYYRIAGYFSSSSLAVSARGISGLIKNGGKMRIICSPNLSRADMEIIESNTDLARVVLEKQFISDYDSLEDQIEKDHVKALGWLLAKDLLEIRIAYVIDNDKFVNKSALFHQKVGILVDKEGNSISFSGSINETASGWLNNIEEFKVFKSWLDGQEEYLKKDEKKFEEFWNSKRKNVRVLPISKALKEKMVEMSTDFDIEEFMAREYVKLSKNNEVEKKLSLFNYQKEAIEMWKKNDHKLLFEMATGTGKTRTAIGCINYLKKTISNVIYIISCPQSTLSLQWKSQVESLGICFDSVVIADGSNRKWRSEFKNIINKIEVGFYKDAIIYGTHKTCSSNDFLDIASSTKKLEYVFIGDEAHGFGSLKIREALLENYKYRIGLSATPKRWFDDIGSSIINDYYGKKSFEFSISDALSTINPLTGKPFLVNYYYKPFFVELTDKELDEYIKLSKKISKLSSYKKNSLEFEEQYESLLFQRSNIQKNAMCKFRALEEIIEEISPVEKVLIFTSPQQIDETMKILSNKNVRAHRYTQDQNTNPNSKFDGLSERQYLIEKFKQGVYQTLVSIKCLDEGIDIPESDTAILMANSTNPREYIQRIGRVIRQSEGKTRAQIFDVVVIPNYDRINDPVVKEFEHKIFSKEIERIKDMSKNSINNAEVLSTINEKFRRLINGSK